MKLAIISDVHGNLPALNRVIDANKDVDGYICLGDVVNYGPWSNECVDIITALPNSIYIKGNHEEYFLKGEYKGDNEVVKAFFDFCYPKFTKIDKIKNLPDTYELNGFTFSHTIEDRYIYPDSEVKLDSNHVVGHSHHQFRIEDNGYKLYNPGSVGQNRGFINVINYMVLDTDTMDFVEKSITYDADLVIDEMRRSGYPEICIDYYNNKSRAKT